MLSVVLAPDAGGCGGPTASDACLIPADCAGRSAGSRFYDLSAKLRAKGVSAPDASVCDSDFGRTTHRIAHLAIPALGP